MVVRDDGSEASSALVEATAGAESFAGVEVDVRSVRGSGLPAAPGPTRVRPLQARSILTRNESPDVPFDQAINPYRGCEFGCIYCFARRTHPFLGLSAGLDHERRLFCKPQAAALLRRELSRPRYRCAPVALASNTDAYQPVERPLRLTRQVLEVLSAADHPVQLVTKSALIVRDLELLAGLAARRLVSVAITLTTLDPALARRLEPRAPTPLARLRTIARLAAAGVPVGVLLSPVLPGLTDTEIEGLLAAAAAAGARSASYQLLRLPQEVGPLFVEWLEHHLPDRASHVLGLVRQLRHGGLTDAEFGRRMHGEGPLAELLDRRFVVAARRHGLDRPGPELDTRRFHPPDRGRQLTLF